MTANKTYSKPDLNHVADMIDGRQLSTSDPEELELLRLSGAIGQKLYEESDKVKQMEREDWTLFSATHHLPETRPHRRSLSISRHFWRGVLSGAAASFVVCALATWMWWNYKSASSGLMAYQATDNNRQVMLQTASGASVSLSTATATDTLALAQLGAKLHKTDNNIVSLQQSDECLDYMAPQTMPSEVEMQILTVPNGMDFALQLADGTRVYLNAESRLEYPSRFEGTERIVSLQGEACFEVAKDAQHPFVVQCKDVTTRVLGTTFVVRNYEENLPTIALIDGRVEVCSNSRPDAVVQLAPGQVAQLARNDSLVLIDEDIDQFTYWRSGYFYYDNKELVEIATEIGRWYNVNVVFESEVPMHLRMHYFCNRNANIEEAIRILNYQPDLNIKLAERTIYIR